MYTIRLQFVLLNKKCIFFQKVYFIECKSKLGKKQIFSPKVIKNIKKPSLIKSETLNHLQQNNHHDRHYKGHQLGGHRWIANPVHQKALCHEVYEGLEKCLAKPLHLYRDLREKLRGAKQDDNEEEVQRIKKELDTIKNLRVKLLTNKA